MTIEQLKKIGAIYFENIRTGLNLYQSEILVLDKHFAYQKLSEMWKKNGKDHAFVDFYYYSIESTARERVKSVLSQAESAYLDCKRAGMGQVIFPLEEELLRIAVKLNALEMLFSTIYFTEEKSTWWGNYNQEYVVFREKKQE